MEAGLCALAKEPPGCEVGAAATRALPATGSKWIREHVAGKSDMMGCPTDRLIDRVMDKYTEKVSRRCNYTIVRLLNVHNLNNFT